jgi:hypothetical protein
MEALSFQASASECQFPKGCCKPESGVPAIVRANGVDAAFPIDLKAYVAYASNHPDLFPDTAGKLYNRAGAIRSRPDAGEDPEVKQDRFDGIEIWFCVSVFKPYPG